MSMREQEEVQKMSSWKRVGIAAVVSSAVILVYALTAYAASNDVGNNNAGTVTQSSADSTATTGASTATTGASTSGANIKVERGASYTAPSLSHAQVGTEVIQLHSFLGGATFANTELDTRVRLKIDTIIGAHKVGLISQENAEARIGLALNDMDDIQKERRVPILGFSCNHKSLFNLAGMLCN